MLSHPVGLVCDATPGNCRDNIGLPGMAQYFKEASEEEREHAQMLITFQVTCQILQPFSSARGLQGAFRQDIAWTAIAGAEHPWRKGEAGGHRCTRDGVQSP